MVPRTAQTVIPVEQRMVVMERIPATSITFTHEVPTPACVGREGAKFIRREG